MVSDISSSEYGIRARLLIDLAERLRSLGAHDLVNIPQIVVIGGQSAGKSSLVEAVTGIRVPRDSGTCTRCSFECNIKRDAGSWSCQVSLRKAYGSSNNHLSRATSTPFGHLINDPNDVEIMLRRAQAALLCPWMDPSAFVSMTLDQLKAVLNRENDSDGSYASDSDFPNSSSTRAVNKIPLKFSRNTICVEIKDPDASSLSFIDLPGLIQNEEPKIVNLVEGLVKNNIQRNCLILVTIPMSDDMENQRAKRLAKEADPDGLRTIAVLTKPDTLTSGSTSARQKWADIIVSGGSSSAQHALKHGYYCVKLPDDSERASDIMHGTTRVVRMARESQFFTSTQPWADLKTSVARNRFGIESLVTELSTQLTRLLNDALPGMRAEAMQQLTECRVELNKLPNPIQVDPAVEILRLVTAFCSELESTVYGGTGANFNRLNQTSPAGGKPRDMSAATLFIRSNRDEYENFKKRIRKTAPDFRPFEDHRTYIQPTFGDGLDEGETRDLSDVRQVIKESVTWELPHNVPFASKQILIQEFISRWDDPACKCYQAVAVRLEKELDDCIIRYFSQYSKLKDHMHDLIMEQLRVHGKIALDAVKNAVSLEKYPLTTQNSEYFESMREMWIHNYRDVKRRSVEYHVDSGQYSESVGPREIVDEYPFPTYVPYPERHALYQNALHALSNVGYTGITRESLKRLDPRDDEYEEEILVMADVRAYFDVAYKRIIDEVPFTIEHKLNQALCTSLQVSLIKKLDFGGGDASVRLGQLIAEDPRVVREREKWQARKETLQTILRELSAFGV